MSRSALLRAGVLLTTVCILMPSSPALAQAMKVAAQSIPMPTDEDPCPLTEVFYGVTWKVEFSSIRLEMLSEPGADKVRARWTVTGVNSRPRPTRAQLSIILLDGSDKAVGTAKKSLMVKPGGEPHDIEIEMKVKAGDWERAERVKLQANFFVAS